MKRAFAGLEISYLVPKFFQRYGTSRIERAMIRPCAKENQQAPIQAKRGNPVTDTFLRLWRDGTDRLAKFLKRVSMIGIHARKVLVNRFGFALGRSHVTRLPYARYSQTQYAKFDQNIDEDDRFAFVTRYCVTYASPSRG